MGFNSGFKGLKNMYLPQWSFRLIPVATRSKAWVRDRSLAGTAVSNPTGGVDVCLL